MTIDAMGTQTEIVETIREKEADYLLPVKANQPTLEHDVEECFAKAEAKQWRGIQHTMHRAVDGGHGRVETRTCWSMPLPKVMAEQAERWKDLRSITMIEALREINGQSTLERRYYITLLPAEATVILGAARAHWGIENQLHLRSDFFSCDCSTELHHDGNGSVGSRGAVGTAQGCSTVPVIGGRTKPVEELHGHALDGCFDHNRGRNIGKKRPDSQTRIDAKFGDTAHGQRCACGLGGEFV